MYIEEKIWKSYLDNNEELFNLIGSSFLSSYDGFNIKLSKLIEENKIDEIHEMLHAIKGISLNLGMEKLDSATESALIFIRKDVLDTNSLNVLMDIFDKSYEELKEKVN